MRSLHRTLLALAWISLAGAAQGQPSALFAGTTADVWLLSSDGETAAAYPVSSGTWTESITPTGLSFEVDHQRGTTSIAANPFAFAAVLVNQTQQSLPVLDRSIPPLSLRGLSGALGDEGTTQNPAVALAPDAGTYAETIRVTLRAVPPPGRSGPDVLILAWRDPAEPAFSSISGTLDDPPEQEFFFVRDGDHRLLYFAQAQDGALFRSSPVEASTWTLAGAGPITRDTDGDGVPDLVEAETGMDPLADDLLADRDGDGWTDFEEIARGADPDDAADDPLSDGRDSDGDGWSDWDEARRGTDPRDPPELRELGDTPTARRLMEVEYVWDGDVWRDERRTVRQTDVSALAVRTPSWQVLYDEFALPDAETLAALDLEPVDLPIYRRFDVAASALSLGQLPPLRTPAGEPNLVSARQGDPRVAGGETHWIVKSWVDARPDAHPGAVVDFLAADRRSFTTTQEWLDAYVEYLDATLVQQVDVDLGPETGLGMALLEAAVAWFAQLTEGGLVTLGEAMSFGPTDAVIALATAIGPREDPDTGAQTDPGRSLSELHAEYAALAQRDLPAFAAAVAAIYASAPEDLPERTTTRSVAALLQGPAHDDEPAAAYAARLLATLPLAAVDALAPADRGELLSPGGDSDLDGLTNADELASAPEGAVAGAVDADDSDGDGLGDAADPCPAQPDNGCLNEGPLRADADGDGVIDPLDNCLNDANPDQRDANDDGVGDACRGFANILTPVFNPIVLPGGSVEFTSIETERAATPPLRYQWLFSGGLPTLSDPNPGPVVFPSPGIYTVRLAVVDGDDERSLDTRIVTVAGAMPSVEAGGPYAAVEGQSVVLTASASSPNGAIASYAWELGDGQQAAGNPVQHVYDQDGLYQAEVTADDGVATASDGAQVVVADTAPSAAASADRAAGIAPLAVGFQDRSLPGHDPIASLEWSFGDGSPNVSEPSPLHTYTSQGVFAARLEVRDDDGSSDAAALEIVVASPLDPGVDRDADGMGDPWEEANGLVVGVDDSGLDPDGDGFDNGAECGAGTDPQDRGDAPAGPPGLPYAMFRDDFGDATTDDRWTESATTPGAERRLSEPGSGLEVRLEPPDEIACSTTGLLGQPAFDAAAAGLHWRARAAGGQRFCVGLVADVDPDRRIEICREAGGAVVTRTWDEGLPTALPAPGASIPSGALTDVRLAKRGDEYTLLFGGGVASTVAYPALGDTGLRPFLLFETCQRDEALAVDVELVEVLLDRDADALPDALEDPDGNGRRDGGESDPLDPESDGDRVVDGFDNCTLLANESQTDSDGDGIGNACDQDYDGNGAVGISDFSLLRGAFGSAAGGAGFDPDIDADDNGGIGISDFSRLRGAFGGTPGPTGFACTDTVECPAAP